MSFVLLDIGGTFIKCRMSNEKTEYKINFPKFVENNNKLIKEIEPIGLINSIETILNKFIERNDKIDGILISGQMHGWVITDKNFKPIQNIISWQDLRGLQNNYYQLFMSNIDKSDIIKCGNEIKPGSPIIGISFNFMNLIIKDIKILSLLSWVTAQLVENYSDEMHMTDAAAFSCFDLMSMQWNKNIINLTKISLVSLPSVESKIKVVGLSKSGKIPVFTPIGDFQASLLGTNINTGEISLNIATGGQVSFLGDGLAPENMQTRPYFDDLFIHTKTHLPSGRHANYILSKFRTGQIQKNWHYLNSIDTKVIEKVLHDYKFNLDINEIYQNDDLNLFDSDEKLIELFAEILKCYTDILDQSPKYLRSNIIGSGGLITNSSFVRSCLEYIGKFNFKRIVIGEDASLNGLERLSKSF
jgi:xylulokinase